jgi:transcriptional regulator with XRE-family HTH domain
MHNGNELRLERERLRLSQDAVARVLGVSQATLSRMEGSRELEPGKWAEAMAALGRLAVGMEPTASTPDAPPRSTASASVEGALLEAFDAKAHTFGDVDLARTVLQLVTTPDRSRARRLLDAVASARRRLGRAPTAHELIAELVTVDADESTGPRKRFG